MKLDEFSFANRQLAGMLRSGIPLEGGLRQLSASMGKGHLQEELKRLEADLSAGSPLADALEKRQLPVFYRRMLAVGVAANDLPGMLLALADYYSRRQAMWSRLKALLVYPLIILTLATAVSLFVSLSYGAFMSAFEGILDSSRTSETQAFILLWLPTIVLLVVLTVGLFVAFTPSVRDRLRWRLPGFREASLSQAAGALGIMLRGGCPLPEALDLMSEVETGNAAGNELRSWRRRLEAGHGKTESTLKPGAAFPPLFVWLAASGGENLAEGMDRAKEIYYERALRRGEMLLFAALPVSIVALGFLILAQTAPLLNLLKKVMEVISN